MERVGSGMIQAICTLLLIQRHHGSDRRYGSAAQTQGTLALSKFCFEFSMAFKFPLFYFASFLTVPIHYSLVLLSH